MTGTLVEQHGHTLSGESTESTFHVVDGDDQVALADPQPDRLLGQRVEVADAAPDEPGVQGRVRATSRSQLAAAPAPGPRKVLVMLLTTPDAAQPAASPEEAREAVFTGPASTSAFFSQQSAGATSLTGALRPDGDVVGPLALTTTTAGCDEDALAVAADAAAVAAGYAVASYDHLLYVLPRGSACGWGGLGQLPGRRGWANGTLATSVVAHELGHNLGAHHANALRCGQDGVASTLAGTCSSMEYGDPFDIMGFGTTLMSSWHRAQVGQLPAAQQILLRQPGTVTLKSASAPDDPAPKLLLIPRKVARQPVTSWLAVELRSRLAPFDLWRDPAPVTTGLSLRVVGSMLLTKQSELLDTHPETAAWSDAPLQPGETFADAAHGISIRLESVSGDLAGVDVQMPAYVDDVPPNPPAITTYAGDTRAVSIAWGAASDDEAVDHYEIERDGVVIASTPELRFTDDRVATLRNVSYRVIAVDTTGNRGPSEPVSLGLADVTAPSAVPGLNARVSGGRVSLRWSAAQDNRRIERYLVARDGVGVGSTAATSFTERARTGRHWYKVRAVDAAGNIGAPALVRVAANGGKAASGAGARPATIRMVSSRWSASRRAATMRFSSSRARSMTATVAGRTVASTRSSRLTVRIRIPRGARRTVVVIARNAAGRVQRRWSVR